MHTVKCNGNDLKSTCLDPSGKGDYSRDRGTLTMVYFNKRL